MGFQDDCRETVNFLTTTHERAGARHGLLGHNSRGRERGGLLPQLRADAGAPHEVSAQPRRMKPLCGAKTRRGTQCIGLALENGRCRNHGGLSSGPTAEGRARIAEQTRARWDQQRALGIKGLRLVSMAAKKEGRDV